MPKSLVAWKLHNNWLIPCAMWPMYQSGDGRQSQCVHMHASNCSLTKLFDWVTVFVPVYMYGPVIDLLSNPVAWTGSNFVANFTRLSLFVDVPFSLLLHYLIGCYPSGFTTVPFFCLYLFFFVITSCKDVLPTKSCFCSKKNLLWCRCWVRITETVRQVFVCMPCHDYALLKVVKCYLVQIWQTGWC